MNKRDGWIPFEYREFYDFPRSIIFSEKSRWYFIESVFNEVLDEYEDTYSVYRLPVGQTAAEKMPNKLNWSDYSSMGEFIGKINVSDVEFDTTRRGKLSFDLSGLVR